MGRGYCLKWNKYSTVFQSSFGGLYESQELTDVTFVCEGQLIKCHRVVISAASQYFRDILVRLREPNPAIVLTDVRFSVFKALIDFIYCGEIEVHKELLEAVVKAGEKFRIKGLKEDDEQDFLSARDKVHSDFCAPTATKRRKVEDVPLFRDDIADEEAQLETSHEGAIFIQSSESLQQPISIQSTQDARDNSVKNELYGSLSTDESFLREAESAEFDAYDEPVLDSQYDEGEAHLEQTEYSVDAENEERTMNVELGADVKCSHIRQGSIFTSIEQMHHALDSFCRTEGIKMCKKESKKIEGALKDRKVWRKAQRCDPRLVYYKLEYCCGQGGKKHRSKGPGELTSFSANLTCPFNMKIGVTPDGKYLEVYSLRNVHNHEKNVLDMADFSFVSVTANP